MSKVGTCDLCNQTRNIIEGHDFFGVHVMDVCEYGCSDDKSIPKEEK